ncbi:hypothetical protein ACS8YF_00330 [Salinisphaera sp. SWV1]|uniref:hypothetical protein n=1 Tax=Salinisphaera sp. SWV1 TaxID=3454139 RepID=UPI003F835700
MGSETMDRLFTRLAAEFGHKFTSALPTAQAEQATKAVWAERLAGLSMEELRRGVDALAGYSERSNGWPPGATEFRALCRPRREPYERVEFQGNVLPLKYASAETAQKHLDALRQRLRSHANAGPNDSASGSL